MKKCNPSRKASIFEKLAAHFALYALVNVHGIDMLLKFYLVLEFIAADFHPPMHRNLTRNNKCGLPICE